MLGLPALGLGCLALFYASSVSDDDFLRLLLVCVGSFQVVVGVSSMLGVAP